MRKLANLDGLVNLVNLVSLEFECFTTRRKTSHSGGVEIEGTRTNTEVCQFYQLYQYYQKIKFLVFQRVGSKRTPTKRMANRRQL